MADFESDETKILTAGKAQDIGIAGLGDDAAVCGIAALQKQVPYSEELQLGTVIVRFPVPVVVLHRLAVGRGFCEIILPVCQTDQAIGTDGSEQLIHRRNVDHGLRKISRKGKVLRIGDPDGGGQGGRLRCGDGDGLGGLRGRDGISLRRTKRHAAAGQEQDQCQHQGETRPAICPVCHNLHQPFFQIAFFSGETHSDHTARKRNPTDERQAQLGINKVRS